MSHELSKKKKTARVRLGRAKYLDATRWEPGRSALQTRMPPKGQRKAGALVSVSRTAGGVYHNPVDVLAWRLRTALRIPVQPPVTVTDAQGRVIATIDPVTRVRTPVNPDAPK